MSAHMGRDHGDVYALMGEVLPNVIRARTTSPCELCGQDFRSKTHTCPVKKQLGLSLAYRKHREQFPACPPPVPQPPQRMDAQFACAQCPRKFVTAAGLHQHQSMEHAHSTLTRTFLASRIKFLGSLNAHTVMPPFFVLQLFGITLMVDTVLNPFRMHLPCYGIIQWLSPDFMGAHLITCWPTSH